MTDTVQQEVQNKRKKKKKVMRIVLRTVLLICLVAALAIGGLFIYRKANPSVNMIYLPYTASQGTISNSLSFSGSLQLVHEATYTATTAGQVRSVFVAEGDLVTEGQKLLRLSTGQTVEAEFDGRVNQLPVKAGDQVALDASLIQVADFDRMKVSIRVDEYDISDVQVGQPARVIVTATEQTIETVIDSINYISSSSGNVAYYTATAYVDVPQGVYPGMQVTVSIPQSEAQDVVVLKLEAISFDETNQAYVLMDAGDGTLLPNYITTGVSNGNYVEIVSGLRSGDVVYLQQDASSGSGGLFDGLFSFGNSRQSTRMNNNNRNMPNSSNFQRNFTRPQTGGMGGGR